MWTGCALGVVLRVALYAAGVPAYLEEHLELTSPITSHERLEECLFLLKAGISPFAGDTCHHPPLLLHLLALKQHVPAIAYFAFLAMVDVVTALLLRKLAVQYAARRLLAGDPWLEASVRPPRLSEESASEPSRAAGAPGGALPSRDPAAAPSASRLEDVVSPAFVGLSYLLNPITLASCLAHSLQSVQHVAVCAAFCFAGAGWGGSSAAAVAAALYVCPSTPIVLVLPCAYLAFTHRQDVKQEGRDSDPYRYVRSRENKVVEVDFILYLLRFIAAVSLLFACLLGASVAAMGGETHFFNACFASVVLVRDLTPNVGVFWYIFIEVFDRYRSLFLFAFNAHLLFYPWPLHFRVGRHRPLGPWLHCAAAIGIISIFKPYPTASDHGLMLSVLLIPVELLRESEKQFAFLMSGLLFGLSMFPIMTAVWLGRNAGNANFLYNMTLVINVFGCLLLSEWVRAGMKLRRRQHVVAFCRQLVLSALEQVLDGRGAAAPGEPTSEEQQLGTAAPDSSPLTTEAAGDAEGLRRRH